MIIRNISQSLFPDKRFLTHLTKADDEHIHTHEYFEIVYVINGQIKHICNNESMLFQKGHMALLRPGDVHTYKRDEHECVHRDIMIEGELFKNVCSFLRMGLYEDSLVIHVFESHACDFVFLLEPFAHELHTVHR